MEGTTPDSAAPEGRSMSLATIEPAHGLSREQIDLIKATIAKGATDEELRHFVQVCNRLRLDPFVKQIYFIRRSGVARAEVSIDGFRVVAERTRQYRGQTAPAWCGRDGVWRDVWLGNDPPLAARVGVRRDGFDEPLVRTALFKSYAQNTPVWKSMPEVMLLKCAEALALRAAFPNELGGVYTTDEMEQAGGNPPPPPREAPSFPLASLPAQERVQEPEYSPPADVRPDAQVLPFRGPQGAPEGAEDPVVGTAVRLFLPSLRGRLTADSLVAWMRDVLAEDTKGQGRAIPPEGKRALWKAFEAQCRIARVDPAVLKAKAKGGAQ